MSGSLIGWIWKQQLTPTQRLVLLSLNERTAWHDFRQRWECSPSYKNLAASTGYSRTTVLRSINDMANSGVLTIEPRFDGLGRQKNNYFVINAEMMP